MLHTWGLKMEGREGREERGERGGRGGKGVSESHL